MWYWESGESGRLKNYLLINNMTRLEKLKIAAEIRDEWDANDTPDWLRYPNWLDKEIEKEDNEFRILSDINTTQMKKRDLEELESISNKLLWREEMDWHEEETAKALKIIHKILSK